MPINTPLFDVEAFDNKINEVQDSMNTCDLNLLNCDGYIETIQDIIQELDEAEILLNMSKTNANQLLQNVNNKKKQLEQAKKSGCKTLEELISKVENPNQVAILHRIITDKEYSKIYLSGYEPNTDITGKKKYLIGTVNVLGTFNEKKQCREEYQIKLYKEDPKGTFWCSCADHKFNSTKKNIVCKHICFLICKIAKFLKPEIFVNKKLADEDLAQLLAKLTSNSDIWQDQIVAKLDKITLDTFKQFIKAIDDCCPVCWNDMTVNDKPILLACPICKNYIHSECADIWLEQKASCAMCKSDYWKYYERVKSGGSISVKNS
jgi:hypothetical protein